MLKWLTAGILLATAFSANAEDPATRPSVSLDGEWQFRMDPNNQGDTEKWFDAGVAFSDKIQVPGNWQAQGFGEPFHLLRHNYQGIAWYRRSFEVPKDMAAQRVWLRFQSVCNHGEAYLNGRKVGRIESFVAPYEFDVTDFVRPGTDNVVTVRVDSGSTDAIARNNLFGAAALGDPNSANGYVGMTQFLAKWGGIIGRVELQARPDPAIGEIFIRPDVANQQAKVGFSIRRNGTAEAWSGRAVVEITAADGKTSSYKADMPVSLGAGAAETGPLSAVVAIPDMRLWSPEDPYLYNVRVTLEKDGHAVDHLTERTGMREFAVGGGNGAFILNGRPYFLCGIGYHSQEPITGTPLPEKMIYVERLRHLKKLGFNCVRMLSHAPFKEFFDAADEVGMLVQAEGEVFLGGLPMSEKTADLLAGQVPRIIREHRNHPSWYAFACMNEGGGFVDAAKRRYIQSAYDSFRELDPTRYFMASDGSNYQPPPMWPMDIISSLNDFPRADAPTTPAAPPQVSHGEPDGFTHTAEDYRNRPHIWHEFNQSYVGPLPDLDVEKKLAGGVISQEANLMVRHRARVDSFGLLGRYPSLRQMSFQWYHEYLKQAFETARQMPNLDGYHWWVISDIPSGFETDLTSIGILDMVYQPEKFADPESFLPFNSASVLLIDADVDQRVLAAGERKVIGVSISHYGAHPISDGLLSWQLTQDGKPLREGKIPGVNATNGQITKIGSIELEPLQADSAKQLVLETKLQSNGGTQSNSWKFWVFPAQKRNFAGAGIANLTGVAKLDARYPTADKNKLPHAKLALADKMTDSLLDFIVNGGSAILLERNEKLSARSRPEMMRLPQLTLAKNASSILNESIGLPFWPRWIRCNANFIEDHPALRDFPHAGFPDYQMARMFGDTVNAVDFSNADSIARRKMRPLAWGLNLNDATTPVPNFPLPQEFFYGGMITEARIGKGKIILCSLWALDGVIRGYPEAGYLLDCMVDHALKEPSPSQLPSLTADEARKLFRMQ